VGSRDVDIILHFSQIRISISVVRLEVHREVSVMLPILWDITLFSLVESIRRGKTASFFFAVEK
jgi:hypothetical protein